ncbi:peptidyl-prolyl cis-trans isomerase A (cyclophilin A) [Solimonas aquatica]|uniref:Peptidyl-prolyl cis-trans isomerase n=1 Tax=Solimonas aquatica TaxID=489703 RepID=A0A1H8ZLE1_9GAMM|nr:peptidylprolyl isomerase [Solimonas aquatica]SEP65200.1 peptidyl-prolyl cis-trans isomerase A (cyclophilin A) [Solimonas aquatica]
MSNASPVRVQIDTNLGSISLELDAARAPLTVANFVQYAEDGHYEGLVFHRVIRGFMIQGGGYDERNSQRKTRAPIAIESSNGLKNARGTIAMARTNNPNSATSQFFINHSDNDFLDYPGQDGYGYTVFGAVTSGLDVVDKIAETPTGALPPFGRDVPLTPVVINKVSVLK